MLRLTGVHAGYDGGTALHGVDLAVAPGSVHAVVGHNGAGKTTLVHAVAGLHPVAGGRIVVDGRELTAAPAHVRARAGIALVPQGRRVFGSLTVAEHLEIAYRRRARGPWTPDRVLALLPQLAARSAHRGRDLSGGEEQMLALARALLTAPRLLLLDEPTEGLAPAVTARIEGLIRTLAGTGLTMLLTAPQPTLPLAVADRVTVLVAGRVAATFDAAEARTDPSGLSAVLGLDGGIPITGPDRRRAAPAWTGTLSTPSGGAR